MATTSTNAEINNGPESGKFDTVKALNTQGFTAFLTRFKDTKSGDISPEDMQKRFEVFETRNKVVEDIKVIYKNEISKVFGINLDARSLECIDGYISKIAVENIDEFLSMAEKIKDYKEYPGRITAAENAMKSIESKYEGQKAEINDSKETVESAKKGLGLKGKISMYAQVLMNKYDTKWGKEGNAVFKAQKKLADEGIPLTVEGLNKRTDDLIKLGFDSDQDFSYEIGDAQQERAKLSRGLDNLKETMFANLSIHTEILKSAKEIFRNKVFEMAKTSKPKDTAKALNELGMVKYNSEIFGGEVLTEKDQVDWRNNFDNNTEFYVATKVGEVINNLKLGANNFDRLSNVLMEFTDLEELGSKKGEEAKAAVLQYIEQYASKLTDSQEHIEKKILIKQLILKLQVSNSNK